MKQVLNLQEFELSLIERDWSVCPCGGASVGRQGSQVETDYRRSVSPSVHTLKLHSASRALRFELFVAATPTCEVRARSMGRLEGDVGEPSPPKKGPFFAESLFPFGIFGLGATPSPRTGCARHRIPDECIYTWRHTREPTMT